MMSNLNAGAERFLSSVERIQERLAAASRQVSTGKRILSASDAPEAINTLLRLRTALDQNSQIQSNLVLANSDARAADDALSSAIKVMDRALVLATQGASTAQGGSSYDSLAQEVDSLLEQMVMVSQTTVQGRYIFSGDEDGSPAYEVDPTGANGVLQTFPPKSTRQIENPAGGTFSAAMDAQQIFDAQDDAGVATSDNVFAALNGLRVALRSHSATAVTASVDSVTQASTRLNLAQSFYGAVQNRIDAASEFTSAYDLRLRTEISEKEDADITTAALELTQAQTHLNASFQMQGQMPHSSLFDYLG